MSQTVGDALPCLSLAWQAGRTQMLVGLDGLAAPVTST